MPKVWLAIFFGYNGSTYNGIQHQKQQHVKTIENQLFPILYKNGFLATDNYSQLQRKQKYSRIARTDKGVHAIINGFSCSFLIDKKYFDQSNTLMKDKLHLDLKDTFQNAQTNVVYHCFKRVTTRFEMRQTIQSRKYSYICPQWYFQVEKGKRQDILDKLNKCCRQFIGTHNFHNYTRGLKATDPQAKRYIIDFSCQIINQKFIKFNLIGQSFIYNQIRRMIGAIVFVFINDYPAQFIPNTFFKNQFHLPTVPANGLYLKSVDFTGYNKKKQIPQKIQFQDQEIKKSLQNLQKQIQLFIFDTSQNIWKQWYEATKQGRIIIGDDQKEDGMEKGESG